MNLTTRSLRVRGLDTLLDALKEHDAAEARVRAEIKGKGRAQDGANRAKQLKADDVESLVARAKRRGIVTSQYQPSISEVRQADLLHAPSLQPHLGPG